MEFRTKKQISIQITLDENEAIWLRDYLQNATHHGESSTDYGMRERFFNTLKNAIEESK